MYTLTHHIETHRPPVAVHPHHLAPDHLNIAKADFDHMLELGIVHSFSSKWSSPLHMVPKKTPGDHVTPVELSTAAPCTIAVPYLICSILLQLYMGSEHLQSLIWCERIIKYLSRQLTPQDCRHHTFQAYCSLCIPFGL